MIQITTEHAMKLVQDGHDVAAREHLFPGDLTNGFLPLHIDCAMCDLARLVRPAPRGEQPKVEEPIEATIEDHPPCGSCNGMACEEGCGQTEVGYCEMAHAGPNSHKVCRTCGGAGRVV